jgi:ABC-type Na+ efflux pump permease subunit
MAVWALAKKETVLLARDWRASVLLLLLPLVFILVLGLLLGEAFGQKPDDRIRFMIVDLDRGPVDPKLDLGPQKVTTWAQVVRNDLAETAEIRMEVLDSEEETRRLVAQHKQAAVLIFRPDFSDRVTRCSFLTDGINPFYRDGVLLDKVEAEILRDDKQPGQAAIIQQVAQVSLLRVILPYMIGKAFLKLSEPTFIERLGQAVNLPVPADFPVLYQSAEKLLKDNRVKFARVASPDLDATLKKLEGKLDSFKPLIQDPNALPVLAASTVGLLGSPSGQAPLLAASAVVPGRLDLPRQRVRLAELLRLAAGGDPGRAEEYRAKVGEGVQVAIAQQFENYKLTGMTWAKLTRARESKEGKAEVSEYVNKDGSGLLHRGAYRYQLLVPSYTVLFAFFLVMTVGWLFTSERRQGTLKRLRAAPLTRGQILLGKLLPCFGLSLLQGVLLLVAGKLVFGMRWGPDSWSLGRQVLWLLPVVFTTSLAAMGLAVLVAALARTEVQVALYGAVPALVLALIGGCVLPREMMPEQTQVFTLFTPQGWALDAYRELLVSNPNAVPNLAVVAEACGVLAGFGAGFLALAWWLLPLE